MNSVKVEGSRGPHGPLWLIRLRDRAAAAGRGASDAATQRRDAPPGGDVGLGLDPGPDGVHPIEFADGQPAEHGRSGDIQDEAGMIGRDRDPPRGDEARGLVQAGRLMPVRISDVDLVAAIGVRNRRRAVGQGDEPGARDRHRLEDEAGSGLWRLAVLVGDREAERDDIAVRQGLAPVGWGTGFN